MDLKRIMDLRKDREAFHWFLDHICAVVVGASIVEKVKYVKPPREWLSRSLEAFSLLCLENYIAMAKSQAQRSRSNSKPLWTADARGRKKIKVGPSRA